MNTVALTKLKEQQNLTLESLSEICRLCLRSDSVRFDIFNNEEDYKVPLSQRIYEFYRIKVRFSIFCNYSASTWWIVI